jgi:hypothetical protein
MLTRLLFILFAFHSYPAVVAGDNLIPWKLEKKLHWDDFKGDPPENATNAALTSSTILISFNYSSVSLNYDITCAFDKNRSWVRIKNEHILAHEQGHFDITEIHARKLYKSLRLYKFRKSSVSLDINQIYDHVVNDLQQMQSEYDRETDHSRNFAVQKEWQSRISDTLAVYKNFAAYSQ